MRMNSGRLSGLPQSPRSPLVFVYLVIIGSLFTISGPVCGIFIVRMFMDARATASWPSVPGVLKTAQVDSTGYGHYQARVEYDYRVGTTACSGNRLRAAGAKYSQSDAAESALGTFKPGQTVNVYYDPADPSQSILITGAGFPEYALLVVPFLTSGIGIALLGWLFLSRKRSMPR